MCLQQVILMKLKQVREIENQNQMIQQLHIILKYTDILLKIITF